MKSRFDALYPDPEDLVFPSPKNKAICDRNFRNRAWKTILEQCHIEYRKPYAVRYSVISHALYKGADPIAIAEQTGHDKRVFLGTCHLLRRKMRMGEKAISRGKGNDT